jgi:Antibiotic biosynthesis monooxygenase
MAAVELVRFRVAPERTDVLLEARPAMLEDFRADREGFLGARLIRLSRDEWMDIVDWRSPEDFAASRAKGGSVLDHPRPRGTRRRPAAAPAPLPGGVRGRIGPGQLPARRRHAGG